MHDCTTTEYSNSCFPDSVALINLKSKHKPLNFVFLTRQAHQSLCLRRNRNNRIFGNLQYLTLQMLQHSLIRGNDLHTTVYN